MTTPLRTDSTSATRVLGKTRRLAQECATCIFRPGNLMHLSPGQLRQLVTDARNDGGYIICHSTLPYAGATTAPAICRGFADRYTTWQLRTMEQLWGFVDVEPPDEDAQAPRSAPAAEDAGESNVAHNTQHRDPDKPAK